MRGKVSVFLRSEDPNGITPAYAGKRYKGPETEEEYEDHPRVCGEKYEFFAFARHFVGSPPRMRGKGISHCFGSSKVWITPAYAGKSTPVRVAKTPYKDHPRVCGEKTKKIP